MLATQTRQPVADSRLPHTSMPDPDCWKTLWSQPHQTLRAMELNESMSVLDLGCGYGHFTIAAADLAYPAPVVGVDIDSVMLEAAQRASLNVTNCLWLNQDLVKLPNKMSSKFDYVMMHSTFHSLLDPVKFVSDVVKMIHGGGYFSVINWLPVNSEATEWREKLCSPPAHMCVSIEELLTIVQLAMPNLVPIKQLLLPPYHYGVTFQLQA